MGRPKLVKQGQKYGTLTALRLDPERGNWVCVCDCGTALHRSAASLLKHAHPTCRNCITRRENRIGTRYGRFVATEFITTDRNGNAVWRWSCDCGRGELVLTHAAMAKRKTQECQSCVTDRRLSG